MEYLLITKAIRRLAGLKIPEMRKSLKIVTLLLSLWGGSMQTALGEAVNESCLPAWRSTAPGELPISDVFAVERGQDGYVYFGSTVALHRAEGSHMRSWYPDPRRSTALPSGRVRALAAWGGGIFVGAASGLSWFDPGIDEFSSIDLNRDDDESVSVFSLLVSGDRLFVGHRSGLTILDARSQNPIAQIDTNKDGRSAGVYDLEPFNNGVVAITRDSHVFVDANLEASQLKTVSDERSVNAHYAGALSPDGSLWMSTGSGLMRISPNAETIEIHSDIVDQISGRGTIRHIDFDSLGRLWMATDYDYARWNVTREATKPVLCRRAAIEDTDRPLPTRLLSWKLGDQLVLGSSGRGALIASFENEVERIVLDQRYFPGIAESAVWSANEDGRGRLLLATIDGLFRETGNDTNQFEALHAKALADTQVLATQADRTGQLWAATLKGLFVIDTNGARRVPLVRDETGSVEFGAVISMTQIGDSLLAATDNGLVVINLSSREVVRYFSNDAGYTAVNNAPVTKLLDSRTLHVEVSQHGVFVVGAQAIHRINIETGIVEAMARAETDFSAGRMYASAVSPTGDVFIGTSNGLVQADRDLTDFQYITEIDGAQLGQVSALEVGDDGSLWHNSYHGIWRHRLDESTVELYSTDDGLHTNSPNQGGITILEDGRIIIANPKGLSIFEPSSFEAYDIPQASLASFAYEGEQFDYNGEVITLPPHARNLAVRFRANSVRVRNDLRFEYRLSSIMAANNSRTINPNDEVDFAALQPGEYTLSVRSTSIGRGESPWSNATIFVEPYWWETIAARIGILLLLFSLGIGFLIWRARRIERRYKLVGDERTRIAQDFHDTFLQEVLGALMLGRSAHHETDGQELRSQVKTINELLESAVVSARASVQDLADSSREIGLSQALEAHDASALYGATVPVSFVEHGTPWDLRPQRAFFLARIAKEAINNACKHANANRIDVALNWKPFSVEVVVIDDGKGFDLSNHEGRAGFGLASMKRLAESGRADLEVQSEIDAGTRIRVSARRHPI